MSTDPKNAPVSSLDDKNEVSAAQQHAPFSEAIQALASQDWLRLHVPAHQSEGQNVSGLAALIGDQALRLDFPMLFSSIDQTTWRMGRQGRQTPLDLAQQLAAEAWGASRCWFITNGASGGNHVATTLVQGLGRELVVQRSVHSSVIDGIVHSMLQPHFVAPSIDSEIGASHGVTAEQIRAELESHPSSVAVYIVSPSYFGAVPDIAAIAAVAHEHGVPLIVDEAWGSHFGMHPELPVNAVRLGADLVISSTHKGAGSLTQSAMLHLGHGAHARKLETIVDRVVRSYQSTSSSALLLASLDEARRNLVTSRHRIGAALESVRELRARVSADPRYQDFTPKILTSPGTVAVDPFKIAIDIRGTGLDGGEVHHLLIRDQRVVGELATPNALLFLVGATSPIDVDRCWQALATLPSGERLEKSYLTTPSFCEQAMPISEAFFADSEVVPFDTAAGRISSDALAAYPPGVPNVLPGERFSEEVIQFLRQTAASSTGHVRGAVDAEIAGLRVVRKRS